MKRDELKQILERFTVCAIHTTMSNMEAEDQYNLISAGIDMIAETVMICNERKLPSPSAN
jgi:hypothetical protein